MAGTPGINGNTPDHTSMDTETGLVINGAPLAQDKREAETAYNSADSPRDDNDDYIEALRLAKNWQKLAAAHPGNPVLRSAVRRSSSLANSLATGVDGSDPTVTPLEDLEPKVPAAEPLSLISRLKKRLVATTPGQSNITNGNNHPTATALEATASSVETNETDWETKVDRFLEAVEGGHLAPTEIANTLGRLKAELEDQAKADQWSAEALIGVTSGLEAMVQQAQAARNLAIIQASPTPSPPDTRVSPTVRATTVGNLRGKPLAVVSPESLDMEQTRKVIELGLALEDYFVNRNTFNDPAKEAELRDKITTLLMGVYPHFSPEEAAKATANALGPKSQSEVTKQYLKTFEAIKDKVADLQTPEKREAAMPELNAAIKRRVALTGEDMAAVHHELDVHFYRQYGERELNDLIATKTQALLQAVGSTRYEAGKQLGELVRTAQEAHPHSQLLHVRGLQVRQLITDPVSMPTRTISPRPGLMQKVQDSLPWSMAKKAGSLSGTFAKQGWESAKVIGNARMATDQERVAQYEANRKPLSGKKLAVGALAGGILLGGFALNAANNNETTPTAAAIATTAPGVSESTAGPTTSMDQLTTNSSAEVTTAAPAIVAGGEVDNESDEGGEDNEPDDETATTAPIAPPSSDTPITPAPLPEQPTAPITPAPPEAPKIVSPIIKGTGMLRNLQGIGLSASQANQAVQEMQAAGLVDGEDIGGVKTKSNGEIVMYSGGSDGKGNMIYTGEAADIIRSVQGASQTT